MVIWEALIRYLELADWGARIFLVLALLALALRRRLTRTALRLLALAGFLFLQRPLCAGLMIALFSLPRLLAPREPAFPFPGGLPDREIVFMPDAGPHETRRDSRTLGFIHPDGSGRLEFTFPLLTGYVSMFNAPEVVSQAFYPRWSPQGDLVFIIDGRLSVRLIDGRTGRMYGQDCDAFEGPAPPAFDPQGRLLAELDPRSALYEAYRAFERPEATLHARLDLRTCRVHGLLHIPRLEGLTFWADGESPDGWILASGWSAQTGGRILLYHPARGLQEVFPGSGPAFSRDGAWLAYYDPEGYLVVRPVEAPRPQRLVRVFDPATEKGGWLAPPGWSPDGTRLVYGTPQGRMFVVDRRTGQVRELGPGWAPDWRPSGGEGGRPHTLENAGRIR